LASPNFILWSLFLFYFHQKKETSKKLVELASKLMSIVSNVYLIFGKVSLLEVTQSQV
jgi:hypothetical protein